MPIHNLSDIHYFLQKLEESEFNFYLTGSRYFGVAREASDYDFFVQDSSEVREWLLKEGFRVLSTSYPNDNQIAVVYRHSKLEVDVQCMENAALKLKAQLAINKVHALRFIIKAQHKYVWKAVYAALT